MFKKNAPKYVLVLLMVLMVALSLSSVTSAQPSRTGSKPNVTRPPLTDAQVTQIESNTAKTADGRLQVIVKLADAPSVFDYIAAGGRNAGINARSASNSRAATLRQAQLSLVAQASALGATEIRATQFLVNTVTLAVPAGNVKALSALPNVVGVYPDRILVRTDTTSIPLIGAPEAWDGADTLGSVTGEGVVIAVVDTGIDYIHTHFGGPGTEAAYNANNTTDGTDTAAFYPAADDFGDGEPKVIGGHDYVGDAYDASGTGTALIPVPDADPMDCNGHGSHVAGTAAGWGVDEVSATYTGPFDDSYYSTYPDPNLAEFRIGPGVAPRAALIALRVFGCDGSVATSIVVQSIEDAVLGTYSGDVQADVINQSLGSSFGSGSPDDPEAEAVANAAEAGTIFVASAGNSGDVTFITGSPSSSNSGLSVANSVDTSAVTDATVTRTTGVGAPVDYTAVYADFGPKTELTGDVVYASPANGCTALTNAAAISGKIALIDRGTCNFSVKADNAFAAGAAGLIVANNQPGAPFSMGGAPTNPAYNIPSVMISLEDGTDLKAAIAAGATTVTITDELSFVNEEVDTLNSSSSRGPVRATTTGFKPDIAAPGTTITSALTGSGDGVLVISGTSMAAPHMAGVMALLVERYPDWSVQELKALAMNTANNDVWQTEVGTGNKYSPQRVGTGRVDVVDALNSLAIAYGTDNAEGVSITFAYPEVVVGETETLTETITVENKGTSSVTYNTSFSGYSDLPGVTFSVSPSSVTVAAGDTETVTVTLEIDLDVAAPYEPGDNTLQRFIVPGDATSLPRHYLAEESGLVLFTPASGVPLRVAVYTAPRPASEMSGTLSTEFDAASGENDIALTGVDIESGTTIDDITSQVSAFTLVASSPELAVTTAPDADLQYVGVSSDYAAGGGYVNFGFSTYADWNTLNTTFFQIYIDIDQDGEVDYIVYNAAVTGFQDALVVAFDNLIDPDDSGIVELVNYWPASLEGLASTYPFNTNVVALPFPVGFLVGNDQSTAPAFDFWVETYSYNAIVDDEFTVADSVGSAAAPLTFDPSEEAYDFAGSFTGLTIWGDLDGFVVPLEYNFPLGTSGVDAPDILLLHHHNAAGNRAEVIEVALTEPEPFTLVSPASGTVLDGVAAVEAFTTVTWTPSAGATSYAFELNKPDGSVVTLGGLTPAADTDGLLCDATNCNLTIADALGLLDVNGEYVWNVFAFIGAGSTGATNNPFTFTVTLPAPAPFTLLSPENGAVITDTAAVTEIKWTPSTAGKYQFVLFKLSNNVRSDVGLVLDEDYTAAADTDALTCAAECVLAIDAATQALLSDGVYSWSVVALSNVDLEASNAPFTFRVNTGAIDLVVNGGFETAGATANDAANWEVKSPSGDKRKEDSTKAFSGNAYFQFKGVAGESSKLVQKVEANPLFTQVGVVATDVLTAGAYISTNVAAPGKLTIKVKYAEPTAGVNGDGKDKIAVNLATTTGYQLSTASLTADGTVTKLSLQISFKSTSGKMLVDEVTLVRGGVGTSSANGRGALPLPPTSN